jgi:hypothetical protein
VLALSDLHLDHQQNLRALALLPDHPDDWLLLGGDVGHRASDLEEALSILAPRFLNVVWVPGNHELWTVAGEDVERGARKYERLVSICRRHGVLTPEDPYPSLVFEGETYVVAPLFLLYDYSFRPDDVPFERTVEWAAEEDLVCLDEFYLFPDPYPSKAAWCEARCDLSARRLGEVAAGARLVLLNHFSLRQDLVRISIPRFTPWCGTRLTEDWHTRFNAAVVVTGHLHVRATDHRDGVRFEEVSLGYPRQWRPPSGVEAYLRTILPPPTPGGAGRR